MASEMSQADPPDSIVCQDLLLKRLFEACETHKFADIPSILANNSNLVNSKNAVGRKATPLHYASGIGPLFIIEYLLENGADVNAKDVGGLTPLHDACNYGRSEVVSILLKYGSYINARDRWSYTPLHQAAINGKELVCIVLLQNGADPNLLTVGMKTALELAHPKAKPVLTGENKKDELLEAIRCGNQEVMIALLTPLNVNCYTSDGRESTPLHLASEFNRTGIMFLLLKNGANVNARDKVGNTPLNIACNLGNINCVEMLIKYSPSDQHKDIYHYLSWIEKIKILPEIHDKKYQEVLEQSTSDNTTVYFRAGVRISEETVYKIFTVMGTIEEVRNFTHYTFIKFVSKEAAALAICALNSADLFGQPAMCSWAKVSNAAIKKLDYSCQTNAASESSAATKEADYCQDIKDNSTSAKRRHKSTDNSYKKQKLDSVLTESPSSMLNSSPVSLRDRNLFLVLEIRTIILEKNDPNGLDLITIKENLVTKGKITPDESEELVRNVVYFGIEMKLIRRCFP